METQFLKTTGGIPYGPYAFRVSRSERAENASLDEIIMSGINELKVGGDGGIEPGLSKVEFEARV